MDEEQVRAAVQGFLALVRDSELTPEQAEAALPPALDRLALAVHYTPKPNFAALTAPSEEYESRRALVARRFPDLGCYPIADASADPGVEQGRMVGDAADDLADIYGDLCTVETLWAAGDSARALESLGSNFAYHFGRHLRELQLYLHVRKVRS
jgi:hypothetical protein